MPSPLTRLLSLSGAAALVAAMALSGAPAFAQQQQFGQQIDTPQRRAMQQCVSTVLSRLARAKAPAEQVAPAVKQQCDAQLRTVLAAEIQSGRAPCANVDSCIAMAQDHAAQNATFSYQQMAR